MAILVSLLLLCLDTPATASLQQTSAWDSEQSFPSILYGVVDDSQPLPARWRPFREPDPNHLNPDGDERGDGEPDFGWNATAGRFEVVWSRVTGVTNEVVWSHWEGGSWSEALTLSDHSTADLLPRLSFTGGGDTALCYRADDSSIRYRERQVWAGGWEEAVTLTAGAEAAGRPDLADPGDGIRVAYPLAEAGGGWSIVVETRLGPPDLPPGFSRELLALSTFAEDPELRAETQGGLLWVTWKQDESHLAWSRLEPRGWTAPELVPLEDGDWGGARFRAKKAALRSP